LQCVDHPKGSCLSGDRLLRSLELLGQSDHESVRQHAEDDRAVARMGKPAGAGPEREPGQRIGLPKLTSY